MIQGRDHLKALFEPSLLSNQEYVNGLSSTQIKTHYRLIMGDVKELKLRCDLSLPWYTDQKFPLFSLCLLNIAKVDRAKSIRFLNGNKELGMANPWFKLLCQFLDDSCITEEEKIRLKQFAKDGSPFSYYLKTLNKQTLDTGLSREQVGMAYLYGELSRLED